MKKSDLTGSVTTVASEQLKKTPSPSLANALQGQAASVTVNSLSADRAQAEVRYAAWAPSRLLSYICSRRCDYRRHHILSPNDIASTEILKDASAAAITVRAAPTV